MRSLESFREEALAALDAPELAAAREAWGSDGEFVSQLAAELKFRSQTDFLSRDLAHLGRLLLERPEHPGFESGGLYFSDAEVAEFQRRDALGEKMELVEALVSGVDIAAVPEGQTPEFDPNFVGIWGDQLHGGRIVLAVVDASVLDLEDLQEIVGSPDYLNVIEWPFNFAQIESYKAELADELRGLGLGFDMSARGTDKSPLIVVSVLDPAVLPDDFGAGVPGAAFCVKQGGVVVPASMTTLAAPGSEAECVDPPQSERALGSSAQLTLDPNPVTAGSEAILSLSSEGLPPDVLITGAGATWQCWDGSSWTDTHQIVRGFAGDPQTLPVAAGATTTIPAMGLPIPNAYPILIPDVRPGIYRIEDPVVGAFVLVEVR